MPSFETEAFAIRTYPFAEAHKVCVFFTREAGIIHAVAYGSNKLKSRYGSALELFSEVQLKYFEREGKDLATLSDCELIKSSFSIASNPESATLLAYWGELVSEFLPMHQANNNIYRLIQTSIKSLELNPDAIEILARYFEAWLLKFSGFFPSIKSCTVCEKSFVNQETTFFSQFGGIQCKPCSHSNGLAIEPSARRVILSIFKYPPAEFVIMKISNRTQTILREINQQLIKSAIEKELKSYSLLIQIRKTLSNL